MRMLRLGRRCGLAACLRWDGAASQPSVPAGWPAAYHVKEPCEADCHHQLPSPAVILASPGTLCTLALSLALFLTQQTHPGCLAAELRNVGMLKDPEQQAALTGTLQLCRQLAVSYSGLILSLDMFPQAGAC